MAKNTTLFSFVSTCKGEMQCGLFGNPQFVQINHYCAWTVNFERQTSGKNSKIRKV